MPPDPEYEAWSNRPRFRYVATGDTFPHRERFSSWAWHWDPERRAWVEDNGTEPFDPAIRAFRNIPGITITQEPMED